jgi:hypothetical protein
MIRTAPISLCPRQRKPSKSVGASTWHSVAGAAGLVLVGAGFGLALALSMP